MGLKNHVHQSEFTKRYFTVITIEQGFSTSGLREKVGKWVMVLKRLKTPEIGSIYISNKHHCYSSYLLSINGFQLVTHN